MSTLLTSPAISIANAGQSMNGALQAPAANAPNGPNPDDDLPPVNVLVVEDNPINQSILMLFLRRKGIGCVVANNGAEAVDMCQTGCFDIILMDIQMPVMGGIQATKEIRRMEALDDRDAATSRSVVIIAMIVSSNQVERADALAAGCNDIMTKPISIRWLHNKIVEWGSIRSNRMG